jgi:hypothetical protein
MTGPAAERPAGAREDPDMLPAAALAILIAEHPAHLSLHELTRVLGEDPSE